MTLFFLRDIEQSAFVSLITSLDFFGPLGQKLMYTLVKF